MGDSFHRELMGRIRREEASPSTGAQAAENPGGKTAGDTTGGLPKTPTFQVFLNDPDIHLDEVKTGQAKTRQRAEKKRRRPCPIVKWCSSRRKYKGGRPLHPAAVHWLDAKYRDKKGVVVDCYTHATTKKGVLFRCHPDFQREGKWYDWAAVPWVDTEHEAKELGKASEDFGIYGNHYYPGQVLCFYKCPIEGTSHALVHSANKFCSEEGSVTTEVWQMEYTYDHSRKEQPYEYCAIPSVLPGLGNSAAIRRKLGIGAREKSTPPLFRYVLKEGKHKQPVVPVDDWEGVSWERHSPVVRPCSIDDLRHRLFVVEEESTLPDNRRDVLTSPGVVSMYQTGAVNRDLDTPNLKDAANSRLMPYQKIQSPYQGGKRTRDGCVIDAVEGSRIIVVKPREMFWPEEFVLMERLRGEEYEPIRLGNG
jgi:hypothetical protein